LTRSSSIVLSRVRSSEASAPIDELLVKQFKGKTKLINLNGTALRLGHDYAEKNLKDACGLQGHPFGQGRRQDIPCRQ